MILKRITNISHPMYCEALNLYKTSFPCHEQREERSQDEISKRRKGFYERCGFTENCFTHIHPPYHKENEGHPLVVMTCPTQISKDMFDTFSHYLKNKVMKNVFL